MRHIVVATVVLLLGAMGPQVRTESPFAPLWFLGVLLLVAYSFGRLFENLGMPSTVGWFLAGLLVGETGLQLLLPKEFVVLNLLRDATLAWIVFHVALHFYPFSRLDKRMALSIILSTIIIVLTVSVGVWFIMELPWQVSVLIGAISALWGPFSGKPIPQRLSAVEIGGAGGLLSLLIFLLVVVYLSSIGWLAYEAERYVGRFVFSMCLGGISGYVVSHFNLMPRSLKGLLSGIFGVCLLISAVFQIFNLYVLPFVISASMVVSREKSWKRRLNTLHSKVGIFPYLFYFGLIGSFLNLRHIVKPFDGVITVLGITTIAIFIFRGLWMNAVSKVEFASKVGGISPDVFSRGVLTFEILMPSGFIFFDTISIENAQMVMEFVTIDIFLFLVVYVLFIRSVQLLLRSGDASLIN